jgi:hypothetical protein
MRQEFSEETLAALLQAMQARSVATPENPGLIACWPDVREERMASACAVLINQGHDIRQVFVAGSADGKPRVAWSV